MESEPNKELQSLLEHLSTHWENNDQQQNQQSPLSSDIKTRMSNFLSGFIQFEDNISKGNNCNGYKTYKENTEHVLCLGPTGTGKSTVINHLLGNQLECIKLGRNGQTFEIRVNGTSNKIADIGNCDDSQTVDITSYLNDKENIVYWDFPGFFDTQGDIQRIRNAFLLKRFNESVKIAKIILFIDISAINSSRGVSFISFIDMLTSVCDPESVKDNLALLITKVDPFESEDQKNKEKHALVQKFANYYEKKRSSSGILSMLGGDSMLKKLAFIEKPRRIGVLQQDMFSDLISSMQNVQHSSIEFKLCVDSDTNRRLANIAKMLNKYATEITADAANIKATEVATTVSGESFTQDSLKHIVPFSISNDKRLFIESFLSSFGSSSMENSLDTLKNILKTLNFLNQLNSNFEADIVNWANPLTVFNDKYKQLCERPDIQNDDVKSINAAILSTSYLQDLLQNSNDKVVKCHSLVLVVDSDINLPGVTLSIFSKIWNIKGERKISLKGNREKGILNSGNFYGYAEEKKGGSILLELDGVDGEDGKFDLNHVQAGIVNIKNKIKKLEGCTQAVKYLNSYIGKNLEEEWKILTEQLRQIDEDLKVTIGQESALENYAITSDDGSTAIKRVGLEEKSKEERHKMKIVQKELILVEKLNELMTLSDQYKKIPNKYSPSTDSFSNDENEKARLILGIQKARAEISETERTFTELQKANENDLEGMQNLLVKIKGTLLFLTNFVENHRTGYLEWMKEIEAAEKKYCEKHTILVKDVSLDLSAKDLSGILTENNWLLELINRTSEFETEINDQIKAQNKLLVFSNKLIKDTDKGIEKLKAQQEQVKKCLENKATKRKVLSDEMVKLKDWCPEQFCRFEKIFNEIFKVTLDKNAVVAEYYLILKEKDIYLADSDSKSYLPEKREFYGDINKNEFYQNCLQQITKMQNEVGQLDYVKEYMRTKIYVKLIDAAKMWNELVSTLNVSGQTKYKVDIREDAARKHYKVVCQNVRDHLINNKPSGIIDFFSKNSEDELDKFAAEQISFQSNLQKRLRNVKQYKNRMDITLDKYKEIKKRVDAAHRKYKDLKRQPIVNSSIHAISVIDAYDDLVESDIMLEDTLVEEGKIVKDLLLKEINLVKRVERTWGDRDLAGKAAQVLRSMFTFNDQYYESYKLSGSEGSAGNDSGSFYLHRNCDNIITVSNIPGKGGQHACILEGTYLNEYSFAMFRGVANQSNVMESITKGLITVQLNLLDDVIVAAAPQAAAKATGIGFGVAAMGVSVVGLATSPVTAGLNSCWVDGPYKTYTGAASNGEMAPWDAKSANDCDNYEHNLKNIFSGDILSFFNLDFQI